MTELVERESVLGTLRGLLRDAAVRGSIALVAGEAGIGKTSVLRSLSDEHSAHGPVWWGACDALETPHPLAPLLDIARESTPRFATRIAGRRAALFEAVLDDLRHAAAPILMVIEDAHWADDATLDLLKFLGRRVERTRALLAISFRDDEVTGSHPLRRVIGELPLAAVNRVDLARLSPEAVEALARKASRPAVGVHAATRGNPFFVTEVLRDTGNAVPRTVQDVVLARMARLPAAAHDLLRLVSVVPGHVERWLVDELLAPSLGDLDTCLGSGLLAVEGNMLGFRHELGRVAVESSLSPPTAQSLHARVLTALAAEHRDTAPARLAHHAVRASDVVAISRFAPLAARQAHERGAHREAAAQWRLALSHGRPADEAERSEWMEDYALECQTTDQLAEAIEARNQLALQYEQSADPRRQAQNLSRRALVHVLALRNADADADSLRSIALLDPLPACVEQAHAYWVQAQLRMLNRDCAASVEWAGRAATLAQRLGARETEVAALGTLGTALLFIDYPAGCAQLERALEAALHEGLDWVAANSYTNLGSGSGELFRLPSAHQWLSAGVAFSAARQIDFYLNYATAWLGLCEVYQGLWADAAVHASEAAARAGPTSTSRVMALVALGRLRTRRGDPGADEVLDIALELAQASGTLQRVGAVRAARAELAWARGDLRTVTTEAAAALPLSQAKGHPWFIGELAYWMWRAGGTIEAPTGCAEPYVLEMSGDWRAAADAWHKLDCPYERARALAQGDAEARRAALAIFEALGARPAADALRRRLREAGVRGVARGARAATRSHPCGLTAAEMTVLELMCQDLRNAEIAARLHRSVRTIDHHVAAVLSKLGVDSRLAAVRRAQREGWLDPADPA
jgi:DNA-binding CsgD family transcriptional regulator